MIAFCEFGGISVLEVDLRAEQVSCVIYVLFAGVLFWRSISELTQSFNYALSVLVYCCFGGRSPNRQGHSSELYVVYRSTVLEIDLRTDVGF